MVFEAHCISFPCTELLLFNYANVKTVFHSTAPLTFWSVIQILPLVYFCIFLVTLLLKMWKIVIKKE